MNFYIYATYVALITFIAPNAFSSSCISALAKTTAQTELRVSFNDMLTFFKPLLTNKKEGYTSLGLTVMQKGNINVVKSDKNGLREDVVNRKIGAQSRPGEINLFLSNLSLNLGIERQSLEIEPSQLYGQLDDLEISELFNINGEPSKYKQELQKVISGEGSISYSKSDISVAKNFLDGNMSFIQLDNNRLLVRLEIKNSQFKEEDILDLTFIKSPLSGLLTSIELKRVLTRVNNDSRNTTFTETKKITYTVL